MGFKVKMQNKLPPSHFLCPRNVFQEPPGILPLKHTHVRFCIKCKTISCQKNKRFIWISHNQCLRRISALRLFKCQNPIIMCFVLPDQRFQTGISDWHFLSEDKSDENFLSENTSVIKSCQKIQIKLCQRCFLSAPPLTSHGRLKIKYIYTWHCVKNCYLRAMYVFRIGRGIPAWVDYSSTNSNLSGLTAESIITEQTATTAT